MGCKGWLIEGCTKQQLKKTNLEEFLNLLLKDIVMGNGRGLCKFYTNTKGLDEIVKERVPKCEPKEYIRHIYANFKKRFTYALDIGFLGSSCWKLSRKGCKLVTKGFSGSKEWAKPTHAPSLA
uniref:Uncharacterized protein n=1 Tax=Lactuca sativa TaxID=4236 RepID=A0A9R1WJN0_LACSA|nr:hypothetical protein LSAT_V11C200058560 [Lactuca sativa]